MRLTSLSTILISLHYSSMFSRRVESVLIFSSSTSIDAKDCLHQWVIVFSSLGISLFSAHFSLMCILMFSSLSLILVKLSITDELSENFLYLRILFYPHNFKFSSRSFKALNINPIHFEVLLWSKLQTNLTEFLIDPSFLLSKNYCFTNFKFLPALNFSQFKIAWSTNSQKMLLTYP